MLQSKILLVRFLASLYDTTRVLNSGNNFHPILWVDVFGSERIKTNKKRFPRNGGSFLPFGLYYINKGDYYGTRYTH